MILLCNSEKMTVRAFDFIRFSSDKEEPEFSDEAKDIIFPDFDEETEQIEDKQEEEAEPVISKEQALQEALEEERRRKAEIQRESERIISAAKAQADEVLKNAEQEAVQIREKAHSEGLNEGYNEGYKEAYETNKAKLEEETIKFILELRDLINEYGQTKDRLISQNIDELKDVTLSIAEKVIQVSLKTSGEIIKKMIISATEKMKYKEWARIYISRCDSSLLIEGNVDLLKSIAHVSEHIKVIAMEDAAPGTCIIELPDQVIDASASTQIENLKGVLKGVDIGGGSDIV